MEKKEEKHKAESKKDRYIETIGKRKESIARVRLYEKGAGAITINGKKLKDYFPQEELSHVVNEPFTHAQIKNTFDISVYLVGGGIHSQAEALRLGISRALTKQDATLRTPLKRRGLLARDARIKERRKFGKKKARKSPQWSKR